MHRGQGTAGNRSRKMVRASSSNPPFVERLKGILQEVKWDISSREIAQRTINHLQPGYVSPLFWAWRDRSDDGRIYLHDATRQAHL
jgi:hypothetical protein